MKKPPLRSSSCGRLAAAVAAIATGLTSCADDRVPAYPVRGWVTYQDQAAEHAVVVFHPQDGSEVVRGVKPHGRAGPDGCFSLKTYVLGDGAPAGNYVVTIEWPGDDPDAPADHNDPEYVPFGPDRLEGRYANPKTSDLRATVSKGNNRVGPFELE